MPLYVRVPLVAVALFMMWWPVWASVEVELWYLQHPGGAMKLGPYVLFPFCWSIGLCCGLVRLAWRRPRAFDVTMWVLVFTPLGMVFTPVPELIAAALH